MWRDYICIQEVLWLGTFWAAAIISECLNPEAIYRPLLCVQEMEWNLALVARQSVPTNITLKSNLQRSGSLTSRNAKLLPTQFACDVFLKWM